MRPQFKFKQKPAEPVGRFIEPFKNTIAYNKSEKHFLGLKHFIFRYKIVFLGIMSSFLFLFYYLHNLTYTYKSEVTIAFSGFEIPEYSEESSTSVPAFATSREGISRMYNMVYSKEMFDHLINKFNLYAHFGLDPQKTSNYSLLRKILKNHITLSQGASRALTIIVTDKISGVMSANIANEIAVKANDMNKKYITEKIENRIQIYSRLHDEIRNQTQADIASINSGIDNLKSVSGRIKSESVEVEKLLNSLNNLSVKIEGDVGQLLRISNVNSWTMNAMQEDVMNNVQVLQDALPEDHEEYFPMWLLVAFSFIASFLLTFFLFNIAYNSRSYVKLLKA
jgi:hypothetical protein